MAVIRKPDGSRIERKAASDLGKPHDERGLIAPAMRSQMVGRDAAEVPNRSGLETAGAL
jgi:hypothetical protein